MKIKRIITVLLAIVLMISALPLNVFAADAKSTDVKLRRPVSPEQPMWIVHIDTWNYADPAKIIDLIPDDILPYVVFNISMSISWDEGKKEWKLVNDGYELAKSWLRTCAEKRVWAMIQPASGGQCHFPDYPNSSLKGTLFEEFFKDYPNFLGFNYCEQFWGFEQEDFPVTPTERYKHFANLLELTHQYGGYLVVSWNGTQWSPSINPIAMLKNVSSFEKACRTYTENFILCEKHTTQSYKYDAESICLGAYLSGYAGQYGVRYDSSGWSNADGEANKDYTLATGLAPQIERFMQSGMTVIDGPELIWLDDFREVNAKTVSEGYRSRAWEMTDQFQNVMIDMFRKVIDGTIRIPSREEVIEKTKVVIIQDIISGADDRKYSSPTTLYDGLYRMPNDGALRDNHSFFKSTGRYPAIPVVYKLADSTAKKFTTQMTVSEYTNTWRDQNVKLSIFNSLFPSEYTGNIYARSNENSWTIYNPFKTGAVATGKITPKYNTIDKIDLSLSQYSAGVINEYSDSLKIYLNNYDNQLVKASELKTDVIKLTGCTEKPTVTYHIRGYNQTKSKVTASWKNGVYTLTVKHNGPLDIEINCSGSATNRLTEYKTASIKEPAKPPVYNGDRQYEAEHFEYKNISKIVANGCQTGVDKFTGQGYMIFGKSSNAAVKDTISVLEDGTYNLTIRYACKQADIKNLDLYINNQKTSSLTLKKTASNSAWATYTVKVTLKKGTNTFAIKANSALSGELYLDNVVISKAK